jgi:hypothetical protein
MATAVSISNFQFYDNGVPIPELANSLTAMWFQEYGVWPNGAGMSDAGGNAYIIDNVLWLREIGGAQLFQGSLTAPAFSPGTYTSGYMIFLASSADPDTTNPGPISITDITAVPEPATTLLALVGACYYGIRRLTKSLQAT